MAGRDARMLELAGREVRITSPDKVFFRERGETKLDLVRYYAAVAEPLMRAMGGRPVLMQRFPQGAGGPSFFQKRVPDNAPEWLETTTVQTVNGTPSRALVAADVAHVAWAVNLACLGFHVWPFRAADPQHADELRLDLDPQPGTRFAQARAAAWELKASTSNSLRRARRRPAGLASRRTRGRRTRRRRERAAWRPATSPGPRGSAARRRPARGVSSPAAIRRGLPERLSMPLPGAR